MNGIFVTVKCSFSRRQSNLGIPGVWAFHIGSTSPLDNVRPATVGRDLSKAHSSVPLAQSSSHAAALQGDYTEDDLDYYDGNEEELEYPTGEPEEVSNVHSTIDVSFLSKADSGPFGVGSSSSNYHLASPLPPSTPSNRPFYPESESATLDPLIKEGGPVGEIDAPHIRGQVESSEQLGTRGLTPSEIEGDSLDPSREGPPPSLESRNTWPHPDGGALPSERDVPPAHSEGEVVLPHYPVPDHTPPWGPGSHVVGVEDHVRANTEGKWVRKPGAKIPFLNADFI